MNKIPDKTHLCPIVVPIMFLTEARGLHLLKSFNNLCSECSNYFIIVKSLKPYSVYLLQLADTEL